MPQYKEQWIITINRKEFVLDESEKVQLESAMKGGNRWFKTKDGNILSVSHIESVFLHDKRLKNQLPEGEKVQPKVVGRKRLEEFKKNFFKVGIDRGV